MMTSVAPASAPPTFQVLSPEARITPNSSRIASLLQSSARKSHDPGCRLSKVTLSPTARLADSQLLPHEVSVLGEKNSEHTDSSLLLTIVTEASPPMPL